MYILEKQQTFQDLGLLEKVQKPGKPNLIVC